MLRWRLLLGTVFVAVIAALFWLEEREALHGCGLPALALLVTLLASGEMVGLLRAKGLAPHAVVVYVANGLPIVVLVVSLWCAGVGNATGPAGVVSESAKVSESPSESVLISPTLNVPPNAVLFPMALLTFCGGLAAALAIEIVRYRAPGGIAERLAATCFSLLYVGGLMACVIDLRFSFGRAGVAGQFAALVSLMAIVKCSDIGAYTVGRLIGRHKMTPLLSPGKTWEGFLGGVAFGCLAAWLTVGYCWPPMPAARATFAGLSWLPYGLLISVAGIVGDLAESLIKRDCGRKDSSTWMPGFGGVLDIMDSILFAAPVAWLAWALFMPA